MFLVAYQGASRGVKVSLGVYNLNDLHLNIAQMIGTVETNLSAYIINNFASLVFRSGSDLRVVVSVPG